VPAARACCGVSIVTASSSSRGLKNCQYSSVYSEIVHDVGGWRVQMLEIKPSRDALTMVSE
jgi:hypothetical protein